MTLLYYAPALLCGKLVFLFAVCALLVYGERLNPAANLYLVLWWPFMIYVAYLIMLFRPQYSETYTPAAKAEFARLTYAKASALQRKQDQEHHWTWVDNLAEDLWGRWYARYALGVLLLWVAFELGSSGGKNGWILAVLVGISGLACIKEIALWGIGLAVCGGLASPRYTQV